MLSLTRALPSATSAEACASLFGGFIGTPARSDSSPRYTSGVRRSAFPDRSPPGNTEEVSRFSCLQLLSVPGVPPCGTTRDHPPARVRLGACVAFPI